MLIHPPLPLSAANDWFDKEIHFLTTKTFVRSTIDHNRYKCAQEILLCLLSSQVPNGFKTFTFQFHWVLTVYLAIVSGGGWWAGVSFYWMSWRSLGNYFLIISCKIKSAKESVRQALTSNCLQKMLHWNVMKRRQQLEKMIKPSIFHCNKFLLTC